MSVLIGILNKGRPLLKKDCLAEMYDSIKHLPHEKFSSTLNKNLALGHLLTYNTPESIFEQQPMLNEKVFFVAVGRIDNRAELARKLAIGIDDSVPDGTVMQLAFLKYGINCVKHLRGDWSFAAYNYLTEELHLARCPMGYMSMFYTEIGDSFYFSNAIKPLIQSRGEFLAINEKKFVHGYNLLGFYGNEKHETDFSDIYSLPMGSVLTLTKRKKTINKYWLPEKIAINSFLTRSEVNKKLTELFTQATKKRLRSYKPVASMLSGGLDSSSVSYTAAEILKQSNTKLKTFSHVPFFKAEIENEQSLDINKNIQLDESPLIKAIVRKSGNIDCELLTSENYDILDSLDKVLDVIDGPIHGVCNAYWMFDIFENTALQGHGVLLTGEGGNGSISFSGLNHLLPLTLHRAIYYPMATLKILVAKKVIYKYFFRQLLKIKNRKGEYIKQLQMKKKVIDTFQKIQSSKSEGFEPNYKNINEKKILFLDLYERRSIFGSLAGQYFGIELRDPTADQDLIEFLFSIPNKYLFDDGFESRMLVKNMMYDKLPTEVLRTKRKGLQSSDISHRLKLYKTKLDHRYLVMKKHALVRKYFNTGIKNTVTRYSDQQKVKTLLYFEFLNKYF